MGLFDKIDTEKLKDMAKSTADKALDVSKNTADKAKEATKKASDAYKEGAEKSKELKQPVEGAIMRYGVTYLGGLASIPSKKTGEIGFNVLENSFYFKPTSTSIDWFEEMEIAYKDIKKFEITTRTLSTTELLLTDDAKGLQTDNNIEIEYVTAEGKVLLLRIEMLTGITVAGQAIKCKEMMDLLRGEGILDKFSTSDNKAVVQQDDVITQIKKLNELKELGVITEDEFNTKKGELLIKL